MRSLARVASDAEAGVYANWRTAVLPVVLLALSSMVTVGSIAASQGISTAVNEGIQNLDLRLIDVAVESNALSQSEANDLVQQIAEVRGVSRAGLWSDLGRASDLEVSAGPLSLDIRTGRVVSMDAGFMDATELKTVGGRRLTDWEFLNKQHVAMIGADLARSSGLRPTLRSPVEFEILGERFSAVGVIGSSNGPISLARSIAVPFGSLGDDESGTSRLAILSETGETRQSAERIELLLSAVLPEGGYSITRVPDSAAVRAVVSDDLSRAFEFVSVGALAFAILSMWLATRSTFSQRIGEIGMRKLLGARMGDLLIQLAIEGLLLGLAGGLLGTALSSCLIAVLRALSLEIIVSTPALMMPLALGLLSATASVILFGIGAWRISIAETFRR